MNNEEILELSSFLGICDRIKMTVGAKTWKDVATSLEIDPKHLRQLRSEAKNPSPRNRQLPLKKLLGWALHHGVDISWLLTGEKADQENERVDPRTARLLEQAKVVLTSNGPFAEALTKNVEVFHLSVRSGVGGNPGSVKCLECGLIVEDPLPKLSKDGPWVICPACSAKIEIKVHQVEDIKSTLGKAPVEGVDGSNRSRKKRT